MKRTIELERVREQRTRAMLQAAVANRWAKEIARLPENMSSSDILDVFVEHDDARLFAEAYEKGGEELKHLALTDLEMATNIVYEKMFPQSSSV